MKTSAIEYVLRRYPRTPVPACVQEALGELEEIKKHSHPPPPAQPVPLMASTKELSDAGITRVVTPVQPVESICQKCGGPNVTWFAPNKLWNKYAGIFGILCPICFIRQCESSEFKPTAWKIQPETCNMFDTKDVLEQYKFILEQIQNNAIGGDPATHALLLILINIELEILNRTPPVPHEQAQHKEVLDDGLWCGKCDGPCEPPKG